MSKASASATQWKSPLMAALHRNRSDKGVRFLQLATVDRHHRPHNRTVVFRGFVDDSATIMLAVDRRSEKLEQLERNPHAAICWYFSKTREQFRLTGQVTIVTESGVVHPPATNPPVMSKSDRWYQAARLQLWSRLSDSAKLLWFWPHPKGDRERVDAFLSQPPEDSHHPPDTFVLLLFDATEVDRLELRGEPQNRTIFWQEAGRWQVRSVNP